MIFYIVYARLSSGQWVKNQDYMPLNFGTLAIVS